VSGSAALLEVAITKAAAKSIGARFTYPQKRKPWIDATVLELIHRRDDLLALCNEENRKNGGTSAEASRLREEYQRQCRAVRNAIRSRKRQARSKQHKRLEQQQGRQMWQQLRSMIGRGSSSPEIIAREDGSLAHSHKDKLLTAREYFERLGRDTAPAGTFDDAFGAFVSSAVRSTMEEQMDEEPHPVLDLELQSAEIETVLLNLPSGRAAGPDRVHNEMLRHVREAMASALLVLFNLIWQSER
jgi:hypothetical protein